MKTTLLLAALALAPLGFAQTPAPSAPAAHAHVLTRPELDELLKNPQQLLIVDVRRPDEVTKIGGFPVYLSVQIGDLGAELAWIPKDRRIVTVSNHAARATKAAELLSAQGFNVVGAVGAELYEKDGGALTKIVPPAAPGDGTAGVTNAQP
jgi:rhodanese-related sulfurtransferase